MTIKHDKISIEMENSSEIFDEMKSSVIEELQKKQNKDPDKYDVLFEKNDEPKMKKKKVEYND